ncbi:MAG: hypothetical protein JWP38_1428 [Herbaspirillum sp.]|jgi:hypothetical protein|nr:hypothetical protein [Herbaspirillum sp.]
MKKAVQQNMLNGFFVVDDPMAYWIFAFLRNSS